MSDLDKPSDKQIQAVLTKNSCSIVLNAEPPKDIGGMMMFTPITAQIVGEKGYSKLVISGATILVKGEFEGYYKQFVLSARLGFDGKSFQPQEVLLAVPLTK